MYGRFSFLPSAASAVPGGFIGIKPPEKAFSLFAAGVIFCEGLRAAYRHI